MSEFSKVDVELVDGTRRGVSLPPGFHVLESDAGWQAAHMDGWVGRVIARGETGPIDGAALAMAVDAAFVRFTTEDDGRPGAPAGEDDGRPGAAAGEVRPAENEPPSIPFGSPPEPSGGDP